MCKVVINFKMETIQLFSMNYLKVEQRQSLLMADVETFLSNSKYLEFY